MSHGAYSIVGESPMTRTMPAICRNIGIILLVGLLGLVGFGLLRLSLRDSNVRSSEYGRHPDVSGSSTRTASLRINPTPVSLGVLMKGQKAKSAITLTNHGTSTLMIDSIETSCPCLTTAPSSICLGPGEGKILAVEFDPSDEPEFRGRLSVDITGYANGVVAFRTRANLEVRNGGSDGSHQDPVQAQ